MKQQKVHQEDSQLYARPRFVVTIVINSRLQQHKLSTSSWLLLASFHVCHFLLVFTHA